MSYHRTEHGKRALPTKLFCLVVLTVFADSSAVAEENSSPTWTIFITNDTCPDYTWGLTEEQTRQAYADIIKGHLDEMVRTDKYPRESRDHYNAAVTQEVLCFLQRYPDRKAELVRRIREGRLYISPYLCNSLWGFQGFEGTLRTFYPARRLERELGIRIDCAHHIELPSLPWGTATILAGCGIKHLSVPYYNYDSTFGELKTPPLFRYEGIDGSSVLVAMDRFACAKASYTQGAALLSKPDAIGPEWISHYASLGKEYPLRSFLASGTHGDISPSSGSQARSFADKIIQYNRRANMPARLINATLPQFWKTVVSQQLKAPWLTTVRGDFGQSWELWPVSLAKYVADMREGERAILAAETLIAVASCVDPSLPERTRAARERAEWCWAMLSDHAWNGTDDRNQRHNASLRRKWAAQLNQIPGQLQQQARSALKIEPNPTDLLIFNSLSFPRRGIVRAKTDATDSSITVHGGATPCQIVEEDGQKNLCFVSPVVPGFSSSQVRFDSETHHVAPAAKLKAASSRLESPYYSATVDLRTGGLSSLIHRQTGTELVNRAQSRTLGQSIYFDGKEHTLADARCEVVASGPVLARQKVRGVAAGIEITTFVTIYAELDQVDFDIRVHKPRSTREERLCHVFPLMNRATKLRIATPATVIRPRAQPDGDLLPGADTRRFAVQDFVDISSSDVGVTLATLDAFALRLDLDPLSIEALGNDQNYREVTKDQDGETDFRFRYSLQARQGGYNAPRAMEFARGAATPLLTFAGHSDASLEIPPRVISPSSGVIATCLKPADDPLLGGSILRLSEIAGRRGPLTLDVKGYRRAFRTDLLERNLEEVKLIDGELTIEMKPFGQLAVRLLP